LTPNKPFQINNHRIEDREALHLINTEAEFNELIGCEYLDGYIDYELNSLLIARFASYSCGKLAPQRLRPRCNRTELEVEIQPINYHAINTITFGAVLPKGLENEKFRLNLRKVNEKILLQIIFILHFKTDFKG